MRCWFGGLVAKLCWTLATSWTVAHQAPLSTGFLMQENWSGSTGFSRQRNWNGLPFPSPGDLPNAGIKPTSLMPTALADGFFTTSATGKPY